jgi:hypothetical protein
MAKNLKTIPLLDVPNGGDKKIFGAQHRSESGSIPAQSSSSG